MFAYHTVRSFSNCFHAFKHHKTRMTIMSFQPCHDDKKAGDKFSSFHSEVQQDFEIILNNIPELVKETRAGGAKVGMIPHRTDPAFWNLNQRITYLRKY